MSVTNFQKSSNTIARVTKSPASNVSNFGKTQPTPIASAGQYYGFGSFTYMGGEALLPQNPIWRKVNKS